MKKSLKAILSVGAVCGIFGGLFGTPHLIRNDVEATVYKKEIEHYQAGGKHSKRFDYVIRTNKGDFIVEDSILEWNWNAKGDYESIKEGKTYNFETYGSEWFLWITYPVISSYQEIAQQE